MTNLEWLDLSNSAVYGRLESLDNLDSLTTLAIANTQVSDQSMGGRPTHHRVLRRARVTMVDSSVLSADFLSL